MSLMQTPWETYLCSYHGGMFEALAGTIDRTREALCPTCAAGRAAVLANDADDIDETRLRWMIA